MLTDKLKETKGMLIIMRYAIYARYDFNNELEVTVSDQLMAIKNYANAQNLHIGQVFVDVLVRGSSDISDYPEFIRMMQSSRKFDTVLVYRIDRLSKNLNDICQIVTALKNNFKNVISVSDKMSSVGWNTMDVFDYIPLKTGKKLNPMAKKKSIS